MTELTHEKETAMYRQGDVLIVPAKSGDTKSLVEQDRTKEGNRIVLAHGEATGHAHAIHEPGVRFFMENGSGNGLLSIPNGGAKVVHEEHGTIALAPGMYRVFRQREFDAGAVRRVAD